MGNLTYLTGINLTNNSFHGEIPQEMGRLLHLEKVLCLAYNHFGGELPSSVANLSTQLTMLSMGGNLLHGNIPVGIGNLVNLTRLGLEGNDLSGSVPDVIGYLQNLEVLALNYNRFSRLIPSSLGNLTKLARLYMEVNRLEGSIPPSLGNCTNLQDVDFSTNNLNGTMPKQVIDLSSLSIALDMSHNFLTGSLPLEVGNLKNLMELDLSYNRLAGQIPSKLGSCTSLELLHLEGEVPQGGVFGNASAISIHGNDKLCGGIAELQLKKCSSRLNLAIDIAYALEYLHHQCDTPIVHCDLKPSNILLDEDMTAHVGDFGLARLFSEASESQTISTGLKGSIGYIPPEYGVGTHISVLGDAYSYGILLLEMFTGKRPTDEMFKSNMSIHEYVAMAFPEHVMGIADPTMRSGEENYDVEIDDEMKRKQCAINMKPNRAAEMKFRNAWFQ